MGFGDSVKSAIEIVKLNGAEAVKVAKDQNATTMGIAILAIAGVASAIGTLNPVGIVMNPIMMIIFSFIGVGILHILAKLFGGKAEYMQYYRPLAFAYILTWITVIPLLGALIAPLVGLWNIVVAVVITRDVHKLSLGKAIAVVLIPVIVVAVLAAMMVALLGVALFTAASAGALA